MLKGIGASPGAAAAEIFYLREPDLSVDMSPGRDKEEELRRFAEASRTAAEELSALYGRAVKEDGESAQVFEVHKLMLEDPDFCEGVEELINQGFCAEYGVRQSADSLAQMFLSMEGDEYMQARAADVNDIAARLIRILKGIPDIEAGFERPVIVAAEDLLPSQTVKLDKDKVLGFITKYGSSTSHSVILAKTLGIPCIVGMGSDYSLLPESGVIAIDGSLGQVIPRPTEAELSDFARRREEKLRYMEELALYRDREARSPSGRRVLVAANIGGLDDIDYVIKNGADGVGLFRSEFIYLSSPDFPDEESQFNIYKTVLEKLSPRPVVVRTLDLGSDKQAPYFGIENEANPAMGYRAIRICLKERHIFRTQLRALLRASVYGRLNIMFPMISHLEQVLEIKKFVQEIKEQLSAEGLPFSDSVQYGIMVETPAAAVMSDVLAKEVDFFSIGTNDLTQYTMAVDRMNANISELFDSANPAVLRLIELIAKNAHQAGIWVGICGESAANTDLTDFYMRVGIDELSVSPASVTAVKKAVIESN